MSKKAAFATPDGPIVYKKRSRLRETWNSLKTNPGAVFGLIVVALYILMMILSFVLYTREDVVAINGKEMFLRPSAQHWFGTDEKGRDVFTRIVYGSRYSLAVGFGAVGIGLIIGVIIGAISGYFGGAVDILIMRFCDVLSAIPGTLLCMVLVAALGPGLINLLVSIGVTSIAGYIRLARASVLATRGNEYVEAARAIGMSEVRIALTQVLPNSLSPLIVATSGNIASCILSAAGLSFLGFGVPVPLPEWGALVSGGRTYMLKAPWMTTFPGVFIMVITFACALLGDGLRDALDPRLKK